jgi:hypothetical protein
MAPNPLFLMKGMVLMLYHDNRNVGLIIPLEVIGGKTAHFQAFLSIPTNHFVCCAEMKTSFTYGTLIRFLDRWRRAGLLEITKIRPLRGNKKRMTSCGYKRLYQNPSLTRDGRVHFEPV